MNVLVHVCCAPCFLAVVEPLGRLGHQVRGFFYNPNVHPFIEFRRRLKAVRMLADALGQPIDCDETYDLDAYLGQVVGAGERRCETCYRLRLTAAARYAREVGCQAFTTTLLASVHQDHAAVRRTAEAVALAEDVPFLYGDWRDRAEAAHQDARRRHLYLQQYCGCLYSEHQRYKDTRSHVYRGADGRSGGAARERG